MQPIRRCWVARTPIDRAATIQDGGARKETTVPRSRSARRYHHACTCMPAPRNQQQCAAAGCMQCIMARRACMQVRRPWRPLPGGSTVPPAACQVLSRRPAGLVITGMSGRDPSFGASGSRRASTKDNRALPVAVCSALCGRNPDLSCHVGGRAGLGWW